MSAGEISALVHTQITQHYVSKGT